MGYPGYNTFGTSDATKVGSGFTRLRGPVYVGQIADNTNGGPKYGPAHVVTVSTTPADLIWPPALISSAATQGFIFIPQTTGTVTSSGGTSNMSAPAPFIGSQQGGAALIFDANRLKLCIYSTVVGSWLGVTLTSS